MVSKLAGVRISGVVEDGRLSLAVGIVVVGIGWIWFVVD